MEVLQIVEEHLLIVEELMMIMEVSTNVQTRAGGEVDLDNMSYEEMHRFEESMGSVSKGLSKETISRLPVHKHSPSSTRSNSGDA
ncbi:SUPERFAMILY PROTEIN putative-RELATED, partial [Salix purpurea]